MTNAQKVSEFLSKAKTFYFLTTDGNQPKGRPFGFHMLVEDKIYFGCGTFKNVFKLHSVKEVRSFYGRLNSYLDRDALLEYKEPAYCWTHWTRFCLRYPNLSTLLIGVSIYLLMPIRFIKNYL